MFSSDDIQDKAAHSLEMHKKMQGKVRIYAKYRVRNEDDLSLVHMPGTVPVCREIEKDSQLSYDYTGRANRLAIISDGSAVQGMGNIGPYAALPMVEGKCLLLKQYADINAFPLTLKSKSFEDVVSFCRMLLPSVGAINIESVSSPNSFEVVRKLDEDLNIPILCDDQLGSAVSVLAALYNSLTLMEKYIDQVKIVVIGSGISGAATTDLLLSAGADNIVVVNSNGILSPNNPNMDSLELQLAARTNPERISGGLKEAIKGADVLVGLSAPNIVTMEHVKTMNPKPAIFALSMPFPEISREEALAGGAFIYASGDVYDPNPMLNIQAFPGIARGSMDIRAEKVTTNMALAAANALAGMVDRRHLTPESMFPQFFGVASTPAIAEAVAQAGIMDGVAKLHRTPGEVYSETWLRLYGRISHI